MKAYGYLRVSGKGQVDGDGLIRQEQAIRDYGAANGIEIVHIYREEGVSGTKESRAALADMLVSLEVNGHGVTTVIVEKLDRLSRDLMVQESIIRDFQKSGFNLISALEGPDLLSSDPTRKLIRHMFGAIAEYEKDMIVLKLRAARERKRARKERCEGRKVFLKTPQGEKVLKVIRRLRRKPKGTTKRMTHEQIAEELNRMGFKSSTGRPFSAQTVANILRPPPPPLYPD